MGSHSLRSGTWTLQGGGSDIWGNLRPAPLRLAVPGRRWDGECEGGLSDHHQQLGQSGVMLRQTTDPSSAYYAAELTPGNGIVIQYRAASGANASWQSSAAGTTLVYLPVTRAGSTFTDYTLSDGVTWTLVQVRV